MSKFADNLKFIILIEYYFICDIFKSNKTCDFFYISNVMVLGLPWLVSGAIVRFPSPTDASPSSRHCIVITIFSSSVAEKSSVLTAAIFFKESCWEMAGAWRSGSIDEMSCDTTAAMRFSGDSWWWWAEVTCRVGMRCSGSSRDPTAFIRFNDSGTVNRERDGMVSDSSLRP